jgi:large subunit ribosomal protein L29
MKASEIREMSPQDRQQKLVDLKQELFNLRFQREVGQLENQQRIVQTKRDVARLLTVMREELNG